jgi:SAM-dependent methyltransferase
MSHKSQREFIQIVASSLPNSFVGKKVLEVGSLNINGSVRAFFKDCEYIGLDVAPGKNVDIVCEGQKYDAPDDIYDVVISCEVMEHNPYWLETFQNMIRVCKPGGLILMTCATTGRPEHGTTKTTPMDSPLTVDLGWDYYKNLTRQNFEKNINMQESFSAHHFQTNWNSFDLVFIGIKTNISANLPVEINSLFKKIDQYVASENSFKRCTYRNFCATLFGDRYFNFMLSIIRTLTYLHKP